MQTDILSVTSGWRVTLPLYPFLVTRDAFTSSQDSISYFWRGILMKRSFRVCYPTSSLVPHTKPLPQCSRVGYWRPCCPLGQCLLGWTHPISETVAHALPSVSLYDPASSPCSREKINQLSGLCWSQGVPSFTKTESLLSSAYSPRSPQQMAVLIFHWFLVCRQFFLFCFYKFRTANISAWL